MENISLTKNLAGLEMPPEKKMRIGFMKTFLALWAMFLILSPLAGQQISNLRVEQDPALRYYKLTFDLSGKADVSYQIRAVPYKAGKELNNLRYLCGQGISFPCIPGKGRQLFWDPILEGQEPEGWQFRLSASPTPWALVEGGSFQMGSNDGGDDEKPVHQVTVSAFWICKSELTVGEFREFISDTGYKTDAERKGGAYVWTNSKWEQKSDVNWGNTSFSQNDRHPVTCVSWYDALAYCNWRSSREGLRPVYSIKGDAKPQDWSKGEINCDWDANGYRLPTEAEWEFAARGGVNSKGYTYSGSNEVGSVAWYSGNSSNKTHEVGTKTANELGLHDMSGNVWEWCWDWYDSGYYANCTGFDPRGAGSGWARVQRGGGWSNGAAVCRVFCLSSFNPYYSYSYGGFRLFRAMN